MKNVNSKESGQAIIEYILVLTVVVSILLGVMWQFNDGFRKFTNAYFGEYLACLLELGELPALGGTSSGQCVLDWEKGVAKGDVNGKPVDSSGSNTNGKNGSAGGSSGGGSTAGHNGASESSGRFGSNFSGTSREGRPAAVVIGTAKSNDYTGSTEATSGRRSDSTKSKVGTVEFVDQSGGVIDPFEERKAKGAPVAVAKGAVADNLKSKKSRVEIQRKVASKDFQDKDREVGFGDWLRWLLIAAIILAVVIFFGGQALQITKSWE